MRPRKPRVAALSEVEITREKDTAVVRFLDPGVATTYLQVGAEIRHMTDEDILALFDECTMAREAHACSYHHVAVEVPPGPQRFSDVTRQ